MNNTRVIFAGNSNNVRIGNNCLFRGALIYIIDNNNTVIIGYRNDWGENVRVVAQEGTTVKIGSDCQFGLEKMLRFLKGLLFVMIL